MLLSVFVGAASLIPRRPTAHRAGRQRGHGAVATLRRQSGTWHVLSSSSSGCQNPLLQAGYGPPQKFLAASIHLLYDILKMSAVYRKGDFLMMRWDVRKSGGWRLLKTFGEAQHYTIMNVIYLNLCNLGPRAMTLGFDKESIKIERIAQWTSLIKFLSCGL